MRLHLRSISQSFVTGLQVQHAALEYRDLIRSCRLKAHAFFLSWTNFATRLVDVAGRRSATVLVIQASTLLNALSREVLVGWYVTVAEGRFA